MCKVKLASVRYKLEILYFLIRYRVQLLWATDANKDIGFKFFLCKELPSGEKEYDGDLQLRDFNLKNFNQPCSPAAFVPNAQEGIIAPESPEPNPGRQDTELKILQLIDDKKDSHVKTEKVQCDECSWEGKRKAFRGHMMRRHGRKPEITRCGKCHVKLYALFSHSHKCREHGKRVEINRPQRRRCGTCGFKASDIRCHVLLKHFDSKKEQYFKEHYNVERNKELRSGYNCHSCGRHFSNKTDLWRHLCALHGIVTEDQISMAALGKGVVKDKSFMEDQRKKDLERKKSRNRAGTCGTCSFESSDLKCHVLMKHSEKEQYLKEHYNVNSGDKELKDGYDCNTCGKHFSRKLNLWMHICSLHGIVSNKETNEAALDKNVVENQATLNLGSNALRTALSDVPEVGGDL